MQPVLMLPCLRGMTRALDDTTLAAELEHGTAKGVTDAANQFLRRMRGAVQENREELVRLGESFADGR